jgi:invasion protein IalB
VESASARHYLCAMTRSLLVGALCAVLLPMAAGAASKPAPKPAAAATQTAAADPGPAHLLGTVGSWSAYVAQNKEGKICYVAGQPEKTDPAMKRQSVVATVTHRTQDNVSNVVSFDEGYPLNEGDPVTLDVGKDRFTLFARDDSAWAATSDLDRTIVTALTHEKEAVLKATPKKGHATDDTYSLAGFSKALALIDKACDVKR